MEKVTTRHFNQPEPYLIENYLKDQGYEGARKALTQMTPAQVIDEVKKSNLRGLGGAGFSTGTPKYSAISCSDSGEINPFSC